MLMKVITKQTTMMTTQRQGQIEALIQTIFSKRSANWIVHVHQGNIVLVSRVNRPVPIEQLIEEINCGGAQEETEEEPAPKKTTRRRSSRSKAKTEEEAESEE